MTGEVMVSVAMMAYNHEKYIRKALDGVLSQKCNFKYQIVVHDDASPDHTADIIREYAEKYPDIIIPIYQTENQYSQKVNIRTFMDEKLTGKYLAFCECDDYWCDENKLQKQVDFLEAHPDFVAVGHNVKFIDEAGNDYQGVVPKAWTQMKSHVFTLREANNYQMWGQLASRLVVNYNRIPEFREKYYVCRDKCRHANGDTSDSLFYFLQSKVYVMADVMSCYRKTTSGTSYSARQTGINHGERKIQSLSELIWMGQQFGVKLTYKREYCKMVFSALTFWRETKDEADRKIYLACKAANPYKVRSAFYNFFYGLRYKTLKLLSKTKRMIRGCLSGK
ncbi:MAG: glycosyltransferase [Oscillospiraceae bacterium]|nr:glycosyltransferase [Oscillospiraceae bacterium]